MIQEDLVYLHQLLGNLNPEADIIIRGFVCSADELLTVVDEALAARRQHAQEAQNGHS